MIGGNDEEELAGAAGRKVATGDTRGSGETGPGKLNERPEVRSHRKQDSEPGRWTLCCTAVLSLPSTFMSPGKYFIPDRKTIFMASTKGILRRLDMCAVGLYISSNNK